MNKFKISIKQTFTIIFIIVFIIFYLLYLTITVIFSHEQEIPIIMFIGFTLFIIPYFYFLFNPNFLKEKTYNLKNGVFSENIVKILIFLLMLVAFFIPPVNFSDLCIDWSQISYSNYFRSIIFLIGSSILPSSCLFNIFFPRSKIHEIIGVEPFLFKLVLYPILSFTFLGSICFLIDRLGVLRQYISFIIFLIITFLFIIDFILQKYRFSSFIKSEKSNFAISKSTIFLLFIAVTIIIIASSIYLKDKYLFSADAYRILSQVDFIGKNESIEFINYGKYWSYISFSLSSLSGIPIINNNTLLMVFLYLPIISIYFLLKVLLRNFKIKYIILSTIFIISFSNLFWPFFISSERNVISLMIFNFMYLFIYKSFSIVLSIFASSLFIITIKDIQFNTIKWKETYKLIILSSFFLIQSFMIYYFPIIPAFSLYFLILIFSNRINVIFKQYLIFMASFILFFIIFDIISNFYFSWFPTNFLSSFIDFILYIGDPNFLNRRIFNAIIIYSVILLLLGISFFFYKKGANIFKKFKNRLKFKIDIVFMIKMGFILFTGMLILEIVLNFVLKLRDVYFFTLFIHHLYGNIGFIGTLGIFSLIIVYKHYKFIFKVFLLWFLFIISLSFTIIFMTWLNNPIIKPIQLPDNAYFRMTLWFDRTWFYSIIPLSCFAAIGFFKVKKYICKFAYNLNISNHVITLTKFLGISTFIYLTLSNTIISGIRWYNSTFDLTGEDFQIIGWISRNTPRDSGIIADREVLYHLIDELTLRQSYLINIEISNAINNYSCFYVEKGYDPNCSIELLEEYNYYHNVLNLSDYNNNGISFISINFANFINFGTINFNFEIYNNSKNFLINYYSTFGELGISHMFNSEGFYYYNGTDYDKLFEFGSEDFFHYKLDFECTNGNYSGLSKHFWMLTLNDTLLGEYAFTNNISGILYNQFSTSKYDTNYNVYINNITYSWMSNLRVDYCIFKYLIAFEHLSNENVNYLILSRERTEYRNLAEQYINIERDLIPKFYKYKLYEYKNLIIYGKKLV